MTRRLLTSGFLIAGLLLALPGSVPTASAHALLTGSQPRAGSMERHAPARVVLSFSEPVEGNFGALRVYGPRGERLDQGTAYHPAGRSDRLAVRIDARGAIGSSTVAWRVVSVDGHIVAGGYVFSIGRASAIRTRVADVVIGTERQGSVNAALGIARLVQFAAITVALGAFIFLLGVWSRVVRAGVAGAAAMDQDVRRRIIALIRGSGLAGVVASILGLGAQGALASGRGLAVGFEVTTAEATIGTRFGTVWLIALAAWVCITATAKLAATKGRAFLLLVVPLSFLAAMPALSGHSAASPAFGLAAPANVLHVLAVAAWVGGVVTMIAAIAPAARKSVARGRTVFIACFSRFSSVALISVALVLVTGILQSVLALDSLSRLTGTSYGRAILVKVSLLAVLLILGVIQRSVVMPRLQGQGNRSNSIRTGLIVLMVECVVFAAALVATAALASYSPVEARPSGPVTRQLETGGISIALTVDPATTGPNAIHLLLSDSANGTPFTRAAEVRLSESLGPGSLGPFRQSAHRAGPGHWIAPGVVIPRAGTWKLAVDVRVGEFDSYSTTTEVPMSEVARP